MPELIPFGDENQRIDAFSHFVGRSRILDVRENLRDGILRHRVVRLDRGSLGEQVLNDQQGTSIPNVVGIRLERQAKNADRFPVQAVQSLLDACQEVGSLGIVDVDDFFHEAKIVSVFLGRFEQSLNVLREAGSAPTQARIQELRSDSRVGADALRYIANIRATLFADSADGIDEGDFHREERVAGVLDQLCAVQVRDLHGPL